MKLRNHKEDDAVDYPQFRKTAESLCAEDREKERIEKEFALIEKRGWEKYMALFAGILGKERSPGRHISSGGSIRHSPMLL